MVSAPCLTARCARTIPSVRPLMSAPMRTFRLPTLPANCCALGTVVQALDLDGHSGALQLVHQAKHSRSPTRLIAAGSGTHLVQVVTKAAGFRDAAEHACMISNKQVSLGFPFAMFQ